MPDIDRSVGTFHFEETNSIEDLPPFPGDPNIRPPDQPTYIAPTPDIMTLTKEPGSEFPEKWKEEYIGLMYLGYLEDVVDIPFHTFVVRTLNVGEKIEVARITKDLEGLLGFNRAYKAAVVAAGLVLIDGQPIVNGDRKKPIVREKYEYVIGSWHDIVLDVLYNKINSLERRAIEVAYELGIVDAPPSILTNQAVQGELSKEE